MQAQRNRQRQSVHHARKRRAFLRHLDEDFAGPAVFVHPDRNVALVPAHTELVRDGVPLYRHLFPLHARKQIALHRQNILRRNLRFLLFFLPCVQRLRLLRIVAVNRHGLQPQLPRFNVRIRNIFNRRFFRHVDRLRNRAGKERLRRRHHPHVSRPRNRASARRRQRAIEHRQVLRLEVRRAFHFAFLIDVRNDLAGLFRRVAQLHQGRRHRVVHDLDQAAANQFLVLHQRQVRLDARRVAIHHEADCSRRRQHRHLRILVAELFAERQRVVPRFLRRHVEIALHVVRLDPADRLAVHADHANHRLAILRVTRERPHPLCNASRLRIRFAAHQRRNRARRVAALVGIVRPRHGHQ